ncbi:FUSC family protein [Streptomyces sp. NPDC026672]|uniref:FUSC family protein n=1 Tax=unclassified Streptomyces TaxID=2593676 RepID=UPI0034054BE4
MTTAPPDRLLTRLVRVRPAPQRYRTATIAAVCTALPLFAGAAAQRPALGALGSLGSLAALYGRPGAPGRDARAAATATLALATGFLVCSTAQGRPWPAVLVTALWAAVVTVACGALGARPPGIVMPILVGAVATGLPPGNPWPAAAAITATGLLATTLIWTTSRLHAALHPAPPHPESRPPHDRSGDPHPALPGDRGGSPPTAALPPTPAQDRPPSPRHSAGPSPSGAGAAAVPAVAPGPPLASRAPFLRWARWSVRGGVLAWAGVRTAVGVGAGGGLSVLVGAPHPFWAMAAAGGVLAGGNHAAGVRDRALLRGAGTLAGCLLAGAVLALSPGHTATVLLLALLALLTECVVARNYALAMLFVTPMAILLAVLVSPVPPAPWALTGERLLQTLVGCAGALLAGQLVTARWAVDQRLRAVTAVLTATADVLEPRPGRPAATGALARAQSHLGLVAERTAGERGAVREAIAVLDDLVRHTTALAGEAAHRTGPPPPSARSYVTTLRALAAATGAAADPGTARAHLTALERTPADPDLADLVTAVHHVLAARPVRHP